MAAERATRTARTPLTPLPAFFTGSSRIFVGRERELGRLEQAWEAAEAGELQIILMAGEPGVGKTRLAAEFARRVHTQGTTVLAGGCAEDLGVPYQPFVEALRQYVDHAGAPDPSLGRFGGELVRLVPELADREPGLPPPLRSDPATEQHRLFDAVASWLAMAASVQPLLLVLDDLQWAAKPTLLLLRHLARSSDSKLLVVGTYRDSEVGRAHPLAEALGDLRRRAGFARISGKSNKAIAADLHLSEKTVERHLSNIFAKLSVTSRVSAASFAHRQGIV